MPHETSMLVACTLIVAVTACSEPTDGEIQERAITQDEIGPIVASKIYQENAEVLEHQGESIALDEGEIWSDPVQDISCAVFPVHPVWRGQKVGEFSHFIVDLDATGNAVEANLELTPGFAGVDSGAIPQRLSLCDDWGPWEVVSNRCDDWSWWCYGEADMVLRQRSRNCAVNGETWVEIDQATVRHTCGC
jgi:hypothetical protein